MQTCIRIVEAIAGVLLLLVLVKAYGVQAAPFLLILAFAFVRRAVRS
jgi:hypothetical protein